MGVRRVAFTKASLGILLTEMSWKIDYNDAYAHPKLRVHEIHKATTHA